MTQELLDLVKVILLRWDQEPAGTVFPAAALREDLRTAIAQAEGTQS